LKKIVLTDIGKFEIVDAEKPRVTQASDVLLRVLCVGVCGSDIHYYNEGRIGDQPEIFPCIIGHEFSAVVEEIGQAVKSVRIGDVVAVDPLLSCGRCEQCLRGRENTCLNQRFIGSPGQADGCLVEYLLMPEQNCFVVPKEMSAEEAALIEPLSIGYYAAQFLKNANKKSAIGIQGVGPIGLSLVLSLKVFGFDSLYCTDKLDYRLTVAKKCGAAWVGFPDSGDIHESATSAKPEMLDYVFEC